MVLEICVDSVESARAAEAGGAQRLELCSDLLEGGITPSSGLIHQVREAVSVAAFMMVRPRGGDFFYTEDEYRVMQRDIEVAKSLGADGVVFGLLLADGTIDVARTRELVRLARPMQVTFHRAIDISSDIEQSLESVIDTGADRVLTSGGRQTAVEGAATIARMVKAAGERIKVMVCGGVRGGNLTGIARKTGAAEFHASPRRRVKSPVLFRHPGLSLGAPGLDELSRFAVVSEDVRAMRQAIDGLAEGPARAGEAATRTER